MNYQVVPPKPNQLMRIRCICFVRSLNYIQLFVIPWAAACWASVSFNSRVCSNSRPLSWWCHPTISSSVSVTRPPDFNLSQHQSLPVSQLFTSSGQHTRTSASILPVAIQGWFPLGLTGLISLLSRGLSRVSSSPIVWKQPSLWFNSHIPTGLLEKP